MNGIGTSLAVLGRVCEDRQRPIRESNPDLPGWLEEIVDRLLEKDPSTRFAAATDLADLLARHLARAQNPSLPPVDHPWAKRRREAGTRRLWLAGIGTALIGAAAVAGGGVWRARNLLGLAPSARGRGRDEQAGPPGEVGTGRLPAVFRKDFRGAGFEKSPLKVARWNTEWMIHPGPAGLRVTIPASDGARHVVGLVARSGCGATSRSRSPMKFSAPTRSETGTGLASSSRSGPARRARR